MPDWTHPSRRIGTEKSGYLYKQGKSKPVLRDICGHCILEKGKAQKGRSEVPSEHARDFIEATR